MTRNEYEQDLCARAETAAFVPFKPGAGFDGWEPAVGGCHQNVDHWVKYHSGHTAVRGWLAYANYGGDLFGYTAHSVVRGPNGTLFDITPLYNTKAVRGRFIAHVGDDAAFLAIRTPNFEIRCQGNCPAARLDPDLFLQQYVPEAEEQT
ncbi:hypothetical protein [Rhizobium sp. Root651]|uniref:hypothetical protein n=1 Tax=Rhizobium sp. Root651 TaxID=1736577 RepID=UPI00071545C2|nr:hypothetical protein [Rhizobium sp. Root651]KRA65301.1 hypothetical protein ASD85_25450 [Rhizobium sp. Root651]